MKIDAYTCDWCESFANDFILTNDWYTVSYGVTAYHFCSSKCLNNWTDEQ